VATGIAIPKAIVPSSVTKKPDAVKPTVRPSKLPPNIPKNPVNYQRYTDPITGAKYQRIGGTWKMTSGATGIAHGRLPLTGSDAAGTTIATPPTPPPTPAARAPFNYANAYYAYPGYGESMKGIEAQQGGIESRYGFTVRRDTGATSPTRGGAYYKPKGAAEGTGTILATVNPVDGTYVYKDAEGKVYDPLTLDIDVVTIKPGEAGYLEGALGGNIAQSDLNMRKLGDAAAQSGVSSSGIRASMASQEGAARAAREFGLYGQGMADLGATTAKYAELYRTIFDAIKGQAADYNSAPPPLPVAETPTPAPAVAAPNTNPTTQTGLAAGQALSGGPRGQFMGQVGAILAIRDMSPKDRIQQLRAFAREYALTPEQKKYVALQIKKLGGK
jgi:hypothetical protein